MAKKRVIVGYELEFTGHVRLLNDELWPDDNEPEMHSACDVRKMIREDGGPLKITRDWGLEEEFGIEVTPIYKTVDDGCPESE